MDLIVLCNCTSTLTLMLLTPTHPAAAAASATTSRSAFASAAASCSISAAAARSTTSCNRRPLRLSAVGLFPPPPQPKGGQLNVSAGVHLSVQQLNIREELHVTLRLATH